MPVYYTKSTDGPIGIYKAQRPSVAACKSFSTLRRRRKSLEQSNITVVTEGPKKIEHHFCVSYGLCARPHVLGPLMRPIATKIDKIQLEAPVQHGMI